GRGRREARDGRIDLGGGRRDRDPAIAGDEVGRALRIGRRTELLDQCRGDRRPIEPAHRSLSLVTIERTASSAAPASGPWTVIVPSSPPDAPRPRAAVMLRASARRPLTSSV